LDDAVLHPGGVALHAALGGNFDDIDFVEQAEALQEGTVGQVSGKIAMALLKIDARDIAAQCLA
jgi:hypothetical protein